MNDGLALILFVFTWFWIWLNNVQPKEQKEKMKA